MNEITSALAYPDWTLDAACADIGPVIFVPDEHGDEGGKGSGYAKDAKSVCAICPVIDQCLEWALTYESGQVAAANWTASFGVYGGLTPNERRKIIRSRAADQKAVGCEHGSTVEVAS